MAVRGVRGPVAVCTLTEPDLAARLRHVPAVGLAGTLMTANLGIEEIIWAVLDRPWLRFLLVCGRDSPLFAPGQSLISLARHGVSVAERRIIGAEGYEPFLSSVTPDEVAAFRRQVEVLDRREESDPGPLRDLASALAGQARRAQPEQVPAGHCQRRDFTVLHPGGRRRPVAQAGDGFFVIKLDRDRHLICVEHYLPDFSPGYQMCGLRAESMLLGLITAGVVGELGHAGYLGIELAKAESALRLGCDYRQDIPLRAPAPPPTEAIRTSAPPIGMGGA